MKKKEKIRSKSNRQLVTNRLRFRPLQPVENSWRPCPNPWRQSIRGHVHCTFHTYDTEQPVSITKEKKSHWNANNLELKWLNRKISNILHTVTASFNNDSPKTTIYSISLTWISSKTAKTATGSTAAINDENRKISSTGMFLPNKFIKLHAYKEVPAREKEIELNE